ncbi:MAG: ABC transporter ATP-binding protein [Ruthenibacterium sp.]
MLNVSDVSLQFAGSTLYKHVDLNFSAGNCYGIIGANGAGKSTTLHAISNLLQKSAGEISFCNQPIGNVEAHKIISLGLTQVPEGRRIFAGLTVQQNLELGAYIRKDGSDAIAADYEMVFDRLPRLKERRKQIAGTLSGGEQQMLAIGRALMCNPKMLLMDEPSMGLSPLLVHEIFNIIHDVNQSGVTILLVEQNAKMALEIANRAYVLETGLISMSGDASELANNDKVRKAYLGA